MTENSTEKLEQAIEKIRAARKNTVVGISSELREAEILLSSLKADMACPHCEGTKVEPSPDRDLGGSGVTNCACLQCKGLGTKEAYLQAKIDLIQRGLSETTKVYLQAQIDLGKQEKQIEELKEHSERQLEDYNKMTKLAGDYRYKCENKDVKISDLTAEVERLKAENLKAKLAYGLMQDIARKKQGRIERLKDYASHKGFCKLLLPHGGADDPPENYVCNCGLTKLADEIMLVEKAALASIQPEQRRIKCAAIKMDGGKIIEGDSHGNIIRYIHVELNRDMRVTTKMQGFVTESGEFVDRKEALKIAQAAGQIIHKHNPKDVLLSEDLRPLPEQGYSHIHEVNEQDARSCGTCGQEKGLKNCTQCDEDYSNFRPKAKGEGEKK